MRAARTLLVGLGNPIRGDDAIGLRLAAEVAAAAPAGLEVLTEGPGNGLDLVERLAGYARVILLDALDAPDLPPGTLLQRDAGALGPATGTSHVHALELATALELGRRVGLPLPPASEIHVLGVAARATDEFREGLSPEMERAYPEVRAAVARAVAALAEDGSGGERWKSIG